MSPAFRIARRGPGWSWQILEGGEPREGGLVGARAEAAAFVIRGLVRRETGDPHAAPRTLALAAE